MTYLRALRASVVFLTRVPLGGFPYAPRELAWASAWFPIVGAALGAVTYAVFRSLAPAGALPAAMLALGAQLLVTGAFHEDGLADTSDALGGAYERDKLFVILKDSRIGTFGSVALIVSLVTRAGLMAGLGEAALGPLVATGALARMGPVALLAVLPYATPEGSKSRDIARGGAPQVAVAAVHTLAVVAVAAFVLSVAPERLAAAALACAALTALAGFRFWRRAGGVTGDFLGAAEQLGEMGALVAFAWGARP